MQARKIKQLIQTTDEEIENHRILMQQFNDNDRNTLLLLDLAEMSQKAKAWDKLKDIINEKEKEKTYYLTEKGETLKLNPPKKRKKKWVKSETSHQKK